MDGADAHRFAHAHAVEFRHDHTRLGAVDFINNQVHGLVGGAQACGDFQIAGHQAVAGVHHEQDDVGFFHRQPHLPGHKFVDALFGAAQAAGIDDDVGTVADLALAVFTVAGQARLVRHQGVAGTGEAVEESGFADVGAAH